MFDKMRENWRKNREKKQAIQAVYDAISTDDPAKVKAPIEKLRTVELSYEDKGDLLKFAINNQTLPVFKEVLAFVDDPNIGVKNRYRRGDNYYTEILNPLDFALRIARSHDISLLLATDPRTEVTGKMMDAANSGGMQDVAVVLTKRLADLRRQEADVLEKGLPETTPTSPASPAAAVAAEDENDKWTLVAKQSVAHVTTMVPLNRKVTEIFNFESRERVLITENLKTGAETVGNPESFDGIAPANVQRAAEMLKTLSTDGASKRKFSL